VEGHPPRKAEELDRVKKPSRNAVIPSRIRLDLLSTPCALLRWIT